MSNRDGLGDHCLCDRCTGIDCGADDPEARKAEQEAAQKEHDEQIRQDERKKIYITPIPYRIERDGFHFTLPNAPEQIISLADHDEQIRQDAINKTLKEIEEGISVYEKEHKHNQACDKCLGMYIPINIVRRLIEVRKTPQSNKGGTSFNCKETSKSHNCDDIQKHECFHAKKCLWGFDKESNKGGTLE